MCKCPTSEDACSLSLARSARQRGRSCNCSRDPFVREALLLTKDIQRYPPFRTPDDAGSPSPIHPTSPHPAVWQPLLLSRERDPIGYTPPFSALATQLIRYSFGNGLMAEESHKRNARSFFSRFHRDFSYGTHRVHRTCSRLSVKERAFHFFPNAEN